MKKEKILLIIIVLLATTLAIIAFVLSKKQTIVDENKIETKELTKTIEPTTKMVIVPTRANEIYYSETGAKYISPTDEEYREQWLVNDLRSKTPIINEYFEINYNYKTDFFDIKNFKDEGVYFQKWLQDSGYSSIPNDRINIIK